MIWLHLTDRCPMTSSRHGIWPEGACTNTVHLSDHHDIWPEGACTKNVDLTDHHRIWPEGACTKNVHLTDHHRIWPEGACIKNVHMTDHCSLSAARHGFWPEGACTKSVHFTDHHPLTASRLGVWPEGASVFPAGAQVPGAGRQPLPRPHQRHHLLQHRHRALHCASHRLQGRQRLRGRHARLLALRWVARLCVKSVWRLTTLC